MSENDIFEVIDMRKFVTGLLVGIIIMLPVHAVADSMIGKRIEFTAPVKLDGEYLSVEAIGLEGRTYAPVRLLAESLGKDVDWIDGEVIIETPIEESLDAIEDVIETEVELMEPQNELSPEQRLEWIESQLLHLETYIHMRESQLGRHAKGRQLLTDEEIQQFTHEIEESKALLDQLRREKENLEDTLTQ